MLVNFTAFKHMQIHIQMLPQTPLYELWCIVLHYKILLFLSYRVQKCTNQLRRKSKAGSVEGKAEQGLLKTSVQRPAGERGRGEHEYRL